MSDKKKIEQEEKNNEQEESIEQIEEDMQETDDEVSKLKKELAVMQDKYARVYADFDNIKKRLEREKYQALEYALEKFAKELLPVVDSLEGALKAAKSDANPEELLGKLEEGVELTLKQLLSVLEKHGITQVDEEEPFDPNVHHAVQSVDSPDHESGQIVSTFQKGYRYKERTLRDAMVTIAD